MNYQEENLAAIERLIGNSNIDEGFKKNVLLSLELERRAYRRCVECVYNELGDCPDVGTHPHCQIGRDEKNSKGGI